ncbi:MAG TPA: DinB family protein [Terriglobia bacterium]|nr:DinB family protein [Terriglobia bacterium]
MNTEEGKLLCKVYLDTIQQEAETTKKVIRAIPDDQISYKPDAKAKNAHELAWHIASAEIWFLDGVIAGSFSMGEGPEAPPTISGILEWYDTNQKDRVHKVKNLSPDKLATPISFFGVMELPAVAYLNFCALHGTHHRGQLSTYLRPMGSKVPSIYGGSADEPMKM